jgi:hypothetical protein
LSGVTPGSTGTLRALGCVHFGANLLCLRSAQVGVAGEGLLPVTAGLLAVADGQACAGETVMGPCLFVLVAGPDGQGQRIGVPGAGVVSLPHSQERTGASVLMYSGAPLSLGAFRRQVPDANRPYRLPAASVIAPVAFVAANLIIYWSGLYVLIRLAICIVIGYMLIGITMAFDKQRPPLDWRSAQWLPVYLIGMGLLSWGGNYAGGGVLPPVPTGLIPNYRDLLIVSAFSLIIYYWAQAVRLPRTEMMVLVEKQAAVHGQSAPASPVG